MIINMRKIVFIVAFSLCVVGLFAQQEPKAKASLEKAVSMMKSSPVKIVFTTTIEAASSKKKNNVSGTLVVMGNKFHLTMNGTEAYFDGKTQWVYVPESNEVTISTISARDQKQMNPLSVLSQYNGKDTKIMYSRDFSASANQVAIDLFPTSKSANEFRILVKLDKRTNAPQMLQLFGRDGSKTTVIIKSFQKISADNKSFMFDLKVHPKVSVNDLR
jgi:outer membrane lipoprotein-sorting protein